MTEARVYLRPITRDDRDEFVPLMQESAKLHDPWIHPPINNQTFLLYLKRLQRDDHVGLLVIEKSSDAIVGCFNLNNIVRGSFLSASLGYYVVAAFAGQGYMHEGLQLVMEHSLDKLGLHRLEANIQPENHKSIELVRRCGFQKEGLSPSYLFIAGGWRDHERWAYIDKRPSLKPTL